MDGEKSGMYGHSLAVLAGTCAALGSVCAKLAFSSQTILLTCQSASRILQISNHPCSAVTLTLQVLFFGLIFAFNGLMWTLFVKSLQKCSSSLQATVTNASTNFFFSAICGWLLFGETLRLLWVIGASFIVMGLVLINHGQAAETQARQKDALKTD